MKCIRILLSLCSVFGTQANAQSRSIFQQDTVWFNEVDSSFVANAPSSSDSNVRSVFQDASGVVHWTDYYIAPIGIFDLDPQVRPHPKSVFRVVRQGSRFRYITLGRKPIILCEGSLNKKDTIRVVPFFSDMVGGAAIYEQFIQKKEGAHVYKFYYTGDTIYYFKGRAIPCFIFEDYSFYPNTVGGWEHRHKFLMEKKSLLPISSTFFDWYDNYNGSSKSSNFELLGFKTVIVR